jgi:hypothetical protein
MRKRGKNGDLSNMAESNHGITYGLHRWHSRLLRYIQRPFER